MLLAFSIAPTVGADETGSLSEAVAEAVAVVRDSGITHETTSMFTTLEGEWDECMSVVKRCCEVLGERYPRVSLVIKADIRAGHGAGAGDLTRKVASVEDKLARE